MLSLYRDIVKQDSKKFECLNISSDAIIHFSKNNITRITWWLRIISHIPQEVSFIFIKADKVSKLWQKMNDLFDYCPNSSEAGDLIIHLNNLNLEFEIMIKVVATAVKYLALEQFGSMNSYLSKIESLKGKTNITEQLEKIMDEINQESLYSVRMC